MEQKIRILTGADFWSLHEEPAAGLPKVVVSDGPAGVRGRVWDERQSSLLFPSPTSLAATWDPALAEGAGWLMGTQARDKGVHVVLAPTINLHRTPYGGRHFECYSEDPVLTGRVAAAFVTGVQSTGVGATVKHFAGNDSETERMTYDARIAEKALRERYLWPFEEAVRAGAWLVMAAYNKVNGTTMTEHRRLLTDVLKEEWGFDGVVISDWFAARSTEESALGGLDLVMPGPSGPWGERLVEVVRAGRVPEPVIDDKVERVLRLASRVEGPSDVTTPPDARARLRELASRGAVLLRNADGLLPLDRGIRRIALIGANAVRLQAQGGGSAHVSPAAVVSPVDGLRRAFGDSVEIDARPGAYSHRLLPEIPLDMLDGGVTLEFLDDGGSLISSEERYATRFVFMGTLPPGTARVRLRAVLTPSEPGVHQLAVSGVGEFTLRAGPVGRSLSLRLPEGGDLIEALVRPPEGRVDVSLEETAPVEIILEYATGEVLLPAFGLGYAPPRPSEDEAMDLAVAAAGSADVAVVVVGTTDDVESEGFDRTTLALPGRQDELISRVAAANPRTVVVVNAGAPVLMPWRAEASAILHAWLPGQEGGDAIADVLTGAAEPGGRLPTTFPATEVGLISPVPAAGVLDYEEAGADVDVAFPFGHGLGYTTWDYRSLTTTVYDDGVSANVSVRNAGERRGREVIQLYLGEPGRLVGFAVVEADPGESATVDIPVDRRTLARWEDGGWAVPSGDFALRAGRSSADLPLSTVIKL